MRPMNINTVLIMVALVAAQLLYVCCIVMAVEAQKLAWKIAPYVLAMIPPMIHAFNYGLGLPSFLAFVLFLAITKLIVILAAKELA